MLKIAHLAALHLVQRSIKSVAIQGRYTSLFIYLKSACVFCSVEEERHCASVTANTARIKPEALRIKVHQSTESSAYLINFSVGAQVAPPPWK